MNRRKLIRTALDDILNEFAKVSEIANKKMFIGIEPAVLPYSFFELGEDSNEDYLINNIPIKEKTAFTLAVFIKSKKDVYKNGIFSDKADGYIELLDTVIANYDITQHGFSNEFTSVWLNDIIIDSKFAVENPEKEFGVIYFYGFITITRGWK